MTVSLNNFPIPQDLTQLRSFLDLVGYYRQFIEDFPCMQNRYSTYARRMYHLHGDMMRRKPFLIYEESAYLFPNTAVPGF